MKQLDQPIDLETIVLCTETGETLATAKSNIVREGNGFSIQNILGEKK